MNSMPNKTIYIRNEDVELWDNLKDKSQKISELLNGTHKSSVQSVTKKVQDIIKDDSPISPATIDKLRAVADQPVPEPKFKLTGKICKEHKVDVDICKGMKH